MAQNCCLFMSAEGTVVAAGLEENVFAATILWMPRMGMTGRSQPRLSLQSGVTRETPHADRSFGRGGSLWMGEKSL